MQLVKLQAENEEQMGQAAVQRIEIDAAARSPQYHEWLENLLGMPLQGVKECDAVAGGARHYVLALDERADEPGFVADELEAHGQRGQFLDYPGLRGRAQLRNYVGRLKTTVQREQAARHRFGRINLGLRRCHPQHLIVEPGVQHRLAKAPL